MRPPSVLTGLLVVLVLLVAPASAVPKDHGVPPVPVAVDPGKAAKEAEKAAKDTAKEAEHELRKPEKAATRAVKKDPVTAVVEQAAAVVDVATSATAVPTPVPAAPAAPAPAAAEPPAAAPAPTTAAPQPAPARRNAPRRGAVRTLPRRTRSAPRRATLPVTAESGAATTSSPVAAAPAPTATRRPAPAADRKTPAKKTEPRSPLQRTVVRVLEVIPSELRLALGALIALGLALALATAFEARRARRLERQRRRLVADVGLLQSALLPALPRRIADVRVSAAYRPAEGLAAGGDFYDAFEVPGGRTAVIVGDVAGHGRDVVPITALVRYSLRAYLDAGLAPRTALQVASAVLEPQLGERLVTVLVALVDPVGGKLTYACAGHPPPMFIGIDPDQVTVCSSPPIGAGVATGRRQTTVGIEPGVVACFATDGLADARVGEGRFGPDRLAQELAALDRAADADDLLLRVVRRTDSQPDDMAVCLVTPMVGAHGADRERLEELEVDQAMIDDGRVGRFLTACGVLPNTAVEVLRQADGAISRTGSAVLGVRCGDGTARVKVTPRAPVALPLAPVGMAA